MFAICKTKAAPGLEAQNVEAPSMGANEVRIKVAYAGVCGTDMHIYSWDKWAQNRIVPPLVLGHEFSGYVQEVGRDVSGVEVGQLVSAECHIVCGVCGLCTSGQAHLCKKTEIIGVDRRGAFCEEVVVPANNIWPVSKGIAPQSAAIFDPLGNAMHTVKTYDVKGKNVVITGAGAIGLAAVAMAKHEGAKRIVVVEPNTEKYALAQAFGADEVLHPKENLVEATAKHEPDILLEMSGHEQALTQGLKALAMGGKAALLGIPSAPVTLDIAELVVFKGLTLKGVIGRRMFQTWAQVDAFVQKNPHVPERLTTHIFAAPQFQEGFDTLQAGKAIKTVLSFE